MLTLGLRMQATTFSAEDVALFPHTNFSVVVSQAYAASVGSFLLNEIAVLDCMIAPATMGSLVQAYL